MKNSFPFVFYQLFVSIRSLVLFELVATCAAGLGQAARGIVEVVVDPLTLSSGDYSAIDVTLVKLNGTLICAFISRHKRAAITHAGAIFESYPVKGWTQTRESAKPIEFTGHHPFTLTF